MRAQLRGAARRAALGPPSRGAAAGAAQRSVFTAAQFTGPLVFVGAYTRMEGHVDGKGEGIKSYRMSPVDGSLLPLCGGLATPAGPNPTFLVANRAGTRLYAVNECYDGTDSTVTALSIDRASGRLEVLGSAGTGGVAGCFVTLDASEQYVLAANYGSGSVAVIPTDEVTGVGPGVEHKQHAGEPLGPNEARQTDGPHAHAIVFGADATVAYSPDLGLDSVIRYSFDAKTGALEQVGATNASLPGAGPRHMAWSPCGKHAYVSNELSASVTTFALQEESGKEGELKSVHHDSTLPSDWEMGDWLSAGGPDPENGISQCAHVEVTPDGKKVLVSNRGHDSLAVFERDATTGLLQLLQHKKTGGAIPRHFCVSPDSAFALVANQDSNNIVTFAVGKKKGAGLRRTGAVAKTPTPVAVLIVE